MDSPRLNRTTPSLVRRKSVSLSPENLVNLAELQPGQRLPLLICPQVGGVSLPAWAANNRALIEEKLRLHGGILFRGFNVHEVPEFEQFTQSVSSDLLEYRERSSPREKLHGNVYTSTEYPHEYSIFLHNENSYASKWPLKIFFYCAIQPTSGGETPIADVRRVYARIDPEIRERFARLGVMYVRNLNDSSRGTSLGLAWQTVFQTSDKTLVEEACRNGGYQVEWTENGLRTRRVGQAIAQHPVTDEMLWFNHGTFFHVSTLDAGVRDALLENFREEDLPNQTYYGDGSPIEPEVLDHLRAAYEAETIAFPWQQGDVLLLDNMMTAHARRPFSGARRIAVAMSEAFSLSTDSQ
jgi:alpha-ketoglutarate-dependent taurine dioxygenase